LMKPNIHLNLTASLYLMLQTLIKEYNATTMKIEYQLF